MNYGMNMNAEEINDDEFDDKNLINGDTRKKLQSQQTKKMQMSQREIIYGGGKEAQVEDQRNQKITEILAQIDK